jgi:hypothetical protein
MDPVRPTYSVAAMPATSGHPGKRLTARSPRTAQRPVSVGKPSTAALSFVTAASDNWRRNGRLNCVPLVRDLVPELCHPSYAVSLGPPRRAALAPGSILRICLAFSRQTPALPLRHQHSHFLAAERAGHFEFAYGSRDIPCTIDVGYYSAVTGCRGSRAFTFPPFSAETHGPPNCHRSNTLRCRQRN